MNFKAITHTTIILFIVTATIFKPTIPLKKVSALGEEVSVIVEVEGDPYKWKDYIEDYHPFVEVVHVYDTLLNALAIKGEAKDVYDIDKEDFIQHVFPAKTYKVPQPSWQSNQQTKKDNQSDRSEAEKASESPAKQNQSPQNADAIEPPDRPVDSEYTGEGVKVGVIDTGIAYEHPDLKSNYHGGYDVVEFDEDPMETLPAQGPPTLHGSHVSGIIAANGEMKGVAPDADIYAYRALGPGGVGSSVGIIAAIERAVEDGMDIINLSLGSTVNSPDWPTSMAVNRAIDQGVAVVIANGNSGPENWTVSSPATSVKALSVGASITEMKIPYVTAPLDDKAIGLTPMMGAPEWNLQKPYKLVDGGLGKEPVEDAEGKIVLFERGDIPFTEKVQQAEEAGAVAAIIYNNEKGKLEGGLTVPPSIPVAAVSKKQGKWLLEKAEKDLWLRTSYKHMEDKLASFSSKGPVVANWDIKPEVLAPGVNIASTVPGGYQELQGTSMAAPFVTGVLALIKEAHPDWSPERMKAAVLSTATPFKNEQGDLYAPIAQGMGEIQPEQSINPEVLIHGSRLTFGKVTKRNETKTVTMMIENRSDQKKKFRFEIPDDSDGVTWEVPQTFYLNPGEKKKISINLRVHSGNLQKGLHQGWLTLYNENKSRKLPYLFVNQTADYPKIDGLELSVSPFEQNQLKYRMYLPDGAEELTVDLYDPETLRYIKTIVQKKDVEAGMIDGVIPRKEVGEDQYLALVKVLNGQKYSSIVTDFQLLQHPS
ncbi:S8 family serine peptidase [Virgibacillus sp. MSP4-1]|uniref:S8 family serine peptidase n=1 Tax=Virgibacillus sp. MSP4-1 TaxID=2700081 RepID=UPI0003A57BF2|nr:S8 family serine peptidase [Virgibacillus sp. MSP4-1]QHS23567.1 S8 family serine peptidase [Virgibacillus sp. MSP4-1]